LAWNLNALAGRREFQPVIHESQIIALDAPARQRRQPVAATVFERHHTAIGLAVERDRLAQYRARHQAVGGDIVTPARYVPAVAQEHHRSPFGSR